MGAVKEAAADLAPVDLASDTLAGDIRDWLLGHLRTMPKPWAQMSEHEQSDKVYAAAAAARSLVAETVKIISAQAHESVAVRVGKFTVKDGEIKAEFACSGIDQYLLAVKSAQGQRAVLVLADPEAYDGQRAEAKVDPDQGDLVEDVEQDDD